MFIKSEPQGFHPEKTVAEDAVVANSVESQSIEAVNERALISRLDLRVLPPVIILYLLSFLDRSNVANARIEGLATDLGISGDQYLTGLTLYFVGYVLFEVPCNIVLKITNPQFWLPTLTLLWGVVSTLQGVTQNLSGFFAVRFFLGVAEAGLFPGVVYYLSLIYKRSERQYRVALFFSAASLAGAFGGILAYGISFMNGVGGLHGWRWIFIIEGLATVVIASIAYFFVSKNPIKEKWLSESEKQFLQARLALDSDATVSEKFNWAGVKDALTDPKCWLYAAAFHTTSLPLYTLSLFLPSIITSLGYTAANSQLLTIPPYALATILTVLVAVVSEKVGKRAPFIIGAALTGVIGYIILLANTHPTARPGVSYLGVFFAAAGIYPAVALSLSWPAINVSGQTKRSVANAMQISIGNMGAIIGTQLYRPETAPRYVLGHSFALAYLVLNACVAATLWYVLRKENQRRMEKVASSNTSQETLEEKGWEDEDVRWRFRY